MNPFERLCGKPHALKDRIARKMKLKTRNEVGFVVLSGMKEEEEDKTESWQRENHSMRKLNKEVKRIAFS